MIDAIGETTVQQTARTGHSHTETQRVVAAGETQRTLEERPVETAAESTAFGDGGPEDQSRTRYNFDKNKLIIEQYGKNGELILQLPPVHSESV